MLLVEQQLLQTGQWHWNVMVDAESAEVFETLAHICTSTPCFSPSIPTPLFVSSFHSSPDTVFVCKSILMVHNELVNWITVLPAIVVDEK